METYLSDMGRWLGEWRIARVSKSTVILFAKTSSRIAKLRQVQLFGQQIHWVYTVRYIGVTLDTRLTWSIHIDQVRKKRHRLGVLGPLRNRRNDLSIRNGILFISSLSELWLTAPALSGGSPLAPMSGNCWYFSPSVFALLPVHLGTV